MGIEKKLESIQKLGYHTTIDVDAQGHVVAGVYYKPDAMGMSASVLVPAHITGNDVDEVLTEILKQLNKKMVTEGKS